MNESGFVINGDIVLCALRYALGRHSYAVSVVSDHIVECWPMLKTRFQDLIVSEIASAIEENRAGDHVDIEIWERVLENADDEHLKSINTNCCCRPKWYMRIDDV